MDVNDEDPLFVMEKDKTNFSIKKVFKNSDSEVWKHFGEIVHSSGNIIADKKYTNKIFCIHCFENAAEKRPKFKG